MSSITSNRRSDDDLTSQSLLGVDFDKPQRRVVGPIAFSKQSDRKPFINNPAPHDKRFEYIGIPSISSKSVKMANINLDTLRRDESNSVFGSKTGGLDYNVNYTSVEPRTSTGVLDISK